MLKHLTNLLILAIMLPQVYCKVTLTSAVCTSIDKNFSRFDLCEVKPNKRNIPAFSFFLRLLQLPVNNCKVHIELQYLSASTSTTLINGTWDACEFMKNRKKYRSFNLLYGIIKNYTDINHTCPYNHDLHLYELHLPGSKLPLPVPNGEFLVKTSYIVNNKTRLSVHVDFKIASR